MNTQEIEDMNLVPYAVYGGEVLSVKVYDRDSEKSYGIHRLVSALQLYCYECYNRGIKPDWNSVCSERKKWYLEECCND